MGPADDLAIRLRRAAFNAALAAGDLAGVGAVLAADAMLVTGTDSAVLAGRKAQLAAWKREFAAPAARRNRYVRTPGEVVVSAAGPVALETGAWTCTVGEELAAQGRYAAHWRRAGGDWMIVAEIFVTLG